WESTAQALLAAELGGLPRRRGRGRRRVPGCPRAGTGPAIQRRNSSRRGGPRRHGHSRLDPAALRNHARQVATPPPPRTLCRRRHPGGRPFWASRPRLDATFAVLLPYVCSPAIVFQPNALVWLA